ncbi:MAG TPA: hypothetical protein VL524_10015 [Gemmatimonadaceae bacterium]|nr:hypothetical protein [Gemmatimonadaceae bacterium]
MTLERWMVRSLPLAALTLVGGAPLVLAQWGGGGGQRQSSGQELFQWNGRVDREVQIVMRGGNVWTNDIGRTEPGRARSHALGVLPQQNGEVSVRVMNGRGDVDVIQQPTMRNDYTTIVRVRDPQSGADNYRLVATWQGYANGDVSNRGVGRGRNRNNQNGVYRRGDNDGDDDDRGQSGGRYGQYGQYGNGQAMLHWSGNVDGELEIRVQNGRIDYRTISGQQPVNVRADGGNLDLGRSAARVAVTQNQGRGSVSVVQQPSAWNGYTTVIRIRDPQGGYGYYDFDLFVQ